MLVQTTYTTQNIRPEWEDQTAGLQRLFGWRYTAADTWRQYCAATRQPQESGPAALQRIQELLSVLTLLNVPATPGPTEQMCYILQGQLTEDEKRLWIASANVTPDVSDDVIRAKEDAAAATLDNRHSISTYASDPWFAPRLQHLRTFLRDQPALRRPALRLPAALPTTLPRTLQPLLRARQPKLASAVTCMASSSPTSRSGNASFTARGLRLSPGGTGPAVLAATEAVIRALPAREGAGPGPVSPWPLHLIWGPA